MRINLSDSDLTTNLLSWIPGNQDSQFRLNIFNVISDGYDHEKGHSERIDCLIPYLILNRIWNENIRLSARDDIPTNNPEIEFLVRELIKDFGFEREEILQSLLFLGNTQDHKNGYIAFRSKKEIRTIGDIDAESTVRITFKGKVSIGYTMNSFGYLSYCSKKSNMSILEQPNPEMAVISDITKLSEYHIKSLSTLKNRFEANGNWLDKYLMKYGIPLDPKFVRNPDIGIPIQNITFRRCLLMESIYDSLGRYFKMENPAKKLLTESVINFNNALKKI